MTSGNKNVPMPAARTDAIMILKPEDIKLNIGKYFIIHVIAIDISTIISTGRECFEGGMISAINIAYNAIPIAPFKLSGSIPVEKAPSTVPAVHPMNGRVMSPYINT